jgi:G6PDH family F420-dependent oxidoreductase
MMEEAVEIIHSLLAGGYVNHAGKHYRVDSAKLWDRPESKVPLALAVSGPQSIDVLAPFADALVAVEPKPDLIERWTKVNPEADRAIGQIPISWHADRDVAVERAHSLFRWFGGGWKVNAELPGTAGFDSASQFVRPEDVADAIPCGPDVEPILDAVGEFVDAGFTDVAIVQVGDAGQQDFLEFAESTLLPALRERHGGTQTAKSA